MRISGWLGVLAVLAACESVPPAAPAPQAEVALSSGENLIAFYSERSGGGDVFLYDASSSSLLPLPALNTDAREIPGSITPDGRFIAFQRTASGEDVVLYDRATSSEVPLPGLNSGYDDAGPSLTPDARFIAFVTARSGDANWEDVLLYDRSTSSLVPLPGLNTNGPGGFFEGSPSISADGRYIAFRSNRLGDWDVFLYDRSTSSLVPLPGLNDPDPAINDDGPSISADGRFIAFHSNRGGDFHIYLYDRSTSSLVPLPGLDFPADVPSLSADASYIAFGAGLLASGIQDVFVYDRTRCSLVDLPGLNQPGILDGVAKIAFSGFTPPPTPSQCPAVNHPPVAEAGVDIFKGYILNPEDFPSFVYLVASASDQDLDALSFEWREGSSVLGRDRVVNVGSVLGPGPHTVTLVVDDQKPGGRVSVTVQFTIPELVVLVHGWHGDPRGTFGQMGFLLGEDFIVMAYDYSMMSRCDAISPFDPSTPVRQIAGDLRNFLRTRVLDKNPAYHGKINVLAHSLGGLVTRAYAAGLASGQYAGPYDRELHRVVVVGTPNYGLALAPLARLFACGRTGGEQEKDLSFSSAFIADLHETWSAPPPAQPPISSESILGIAGQLSRTLGEWVKGVPCGVADNDFVTNVWSLALPEEFMSNVGYVRYAHSPDACPNAIYEVYVPFGAPFHRTYLAARQFFLDGTVDASIRQPLATDRAKYSLEDGLLLIRFVHMVGQSQAPFAGLVASDIELRASSSRRPLVCGIDLNCVMNSLLGIVTVLDLPVDKYELSIKRSTGYTLSSPATFTIVARRPVGARVQLVPKRGA